MGRRWTGRPPGPPVARPGRRWSPSSGRTSTEPATVGRALDDPGDDEGAVERLRRSRPPAAHPADHGGRHPGDRRHRRQPGQSRDERPPARAGRVPGRRRPRGPPRGRPAASRRPPRAPRARTEATGCGADQHRPPPPPRPRAPSPAARRPREPRRTPRTRPPHPPPPPAPPPPHPPRRGRAGERSGCWRARRAADTPAPEPRNSEALNMPWATRCRSAAACAPMATVRVMKPIWATVEAASDPFTSLRARAWSVPTTKVSVPRRRAGG